MDELHEAQQLWLAEAVAFSVRRRVEKAAGVRAPDEPARLARGPEGSLAYCPDPEAHPTARLAENGPRPAARRRHLLCARCGSNLRAAVTAPGPALVRVRAERRRQVWRRTV
ncbi:hypothetical protein ACFXGD_13435 [Streptomyces albidoflavus]